MSQSQRSRVPSAGGASASPAEPGKTTRCPPSASIGWRCLSSSRCSHHCRSDRRLAPQPLDTADQFGAPVLDFSALDYLSLFALDDADRVWTEEVNGGTLVLMDMSNLPGATEVVFLEGVTGLEGLEWVRF